MDEAPQKRTREQVEAEIEAMKKKGAERDLADAKMRDDLQKAMETLETIRKSKDKKAESATKATETPAVTRRPRKKNPDTTEASAEQQRKEAQALAEMERARAEAAARDAAKAAVEKKEAVRINLPPKPTEAPMVKLPPPEPKKETVAINFPPEPENPAGTMSDLETEKKDIKTFSPQYIGERIIPLLRKEATVVRDPEVTGKEKEMTVKTTIEKWGETVSIQAILENKHSGIGIKSYEIEAPWMVKKLAEAFIGTELGKVSKLLKSLIENEEQREVTKMEIENGELAVTFGAPAEDSPKDDASTQDPSEKKPGWLRRHWLKIVVGTGIAVGGGALGVKKMNSDGKLDSKPPEPIKKAVENTITNVSQQVYTAPETNLTALAEQKQLDQQKEIEKLRKEFEEKLTEQKTSFSNEVAQIKAKVEKPAPKRLTADEALKRNIEGMKQPTVVTGWTIETKTTSTTSKVKPKAPESNWVPPVGGKVTGGSVDAGGFNYTYNTSPNLEDPGQTPPPPVEKNKVPPKFSDQTLEQISNTFENNIEKIFPKDTLEKWNKEKGEGAYELMSKAEKKVPKADRALFSYLVKLKETTGLEPKSGVRGGKPETIERYMQRTLEKAAEDGKLEELTLK